MKTLKIDVSKPSRVVYARDTRPSGPALVAALEDGFKALGVEARDAGVTTTPVLHYLVRSINTKGTKDAYGEDSFEGYLEKLSTAFKKLVVCIWTHCGEAHTEIFVGWQTCFTSVNHRLRQRCRCLCRRSFGEAPRRLAPLDPPQHRDHHARRSQQLLWRRLRQDATEAASFPCFSLEARTACLQLGWRCRPSHVLLPRRSGSIPHVGWRQDRRACRSLYW